jgi:hypothetical protein
MKAPEDFDGGIKELRAGHGIVAELFAGSQHSSLRVLGHSQVCAEDDDRTVPAQSAWASDARLTRPHAVPELCHDANERNNPLTAVERRAHRRRPCSVS